MKQMKLCESAGNYFVKSPQMNLFWADFSHLNHQVPPPKSKSHTLTRIACHIFRGQTHKAATNFLCLCLVEPRDLFGLNFNHSIQNILAKNLFEQRERCILLQQQPAQTEIMSLKSRLRDEMCLANGQTQRLGLGRVIYSLIFFLKLFSHYGV